MYANLARLYPQKYLLVEFADIYSGKTAIPSQSDYYLVGVIAELRERTSCNALEPNYQMYQEALCWAEESGSKGITGHNRISCSKSFYGECCSYGKETGRAVIKSLLIDNNVPSLGHREIVLSSSFTSIGVAQARHSKYRICTVLDFSLSTYTPVTPLKYRSTIPTSLYQEIVAEIQAARQGRYIGVFSSYNHSTSNSTSPSPIPHVDQSPAASQDVTPPITQEAKETLVQRYFSQNRKSVVRWFHVGYAYSFSTNAHAVEAGLFAMRFGMFGLEPLNVEVDVHPYSAQYLYEPTLKLWIPIARSMSINAYGAPIMDGSQLYNMALKRESGDFRLGYLVGASWAYRKYTEIFLEYRRQVDRFAFENTPSDFNTFRVGLKVGI